MKRILVIAPQSYPVTGAESIVNIKQLKALSNSSEFEIDLVSKRSKQGNYKTDDFSTTQIKLKSLNIIEVDNKFNLKTIIQHAKCLLKFGVVFKGAHWAIAAWPTIAKLLKENKYDYVITKNAPSLLLGAYIKRKYNIKWVATWNDPYPVNFYPHPYGNGYDSKGSHNDRKLVKLMRKYPDVHLFPSKRIKEYMHHYIGFDSSKAFIAPHVALDNMNIELKCTNDKLRIIHNGNLKSPRNPETFLKALSRFVTTRPEAKIEITIQGVYDKNTSDTIEQLKLKNYIITKESVSYNESLKELENHHIALIIEANVENGIFMPTKVSDFMQSGRRIFSISPKEGVLNDLYKNGNISYFAPVDDVDAIYTEITKAYEDFCNNSITSNKENIPTEFQEKYIVNLFKQF